MPHRFYNLAVLLLILLALSHSAAGAGTLTVQLSATRMMLLADGKQSTEITALVRDGGRPSTIPVDVQFQTTSGQLSEQRVLATGGIARVRLTSSPIAGTAHVTAFIQSGGSDVIDVVFTDDPEATFGGNGYMSISASSYLAYSATDRVIEGQGKNGGAKLTYRNMEITADRLQLRCDDSILRAHDNVILKRGKHIIHASRLYYSLQSGQGYAIMERQGKLKPVTLSGEAVVIQDSPTPIPSSYMYMLQTQIKLVIVSRGITYFPGDKLQFRRPRFYQDQQQIMSLPYYELPINSQELFSDQFISVGTSGLGLELPFYYNLTPRSTGILYLRHQQQLGRSYYSTTPGWSVDVIQGYNSQGDHRYEGAYGFTGLTRGDWGFRWTHNQEFNADTQGNFNLDFPQHQGVYSTAYFSQQSRAFRWGANLGAGQTFVSPLVTDLNSDFFAETQPKPLSKNMMYVFGTDFSSGRTDSTGLATSDSTQTLTARAFTRPILLDRRTTLNNSFTVGQLWSSGGSSGMIGLASLSLDHTAPGGHVMTMTYDFVMRPNTSSETFGNHRVGVSYSLTSKKRFQATLFGSTFLDAKASSLFADAVYRLDGRWRILTSVTLQTFGSDSYNDIQFTIGRRVGARELQLTYSTYNKRLSFDMTATRF